MTCADNGDAITPRLRITSSACGPCAHCDPALAVLARSPTQSERSCWVSKQAPNVTLRSEEHTSELQSLMRNSYAVLCLKKKKQQTTTLLTHANQEKIKLNTTNIDHTNAKLTHL